MTGAATGRETGTDEPSTPGALSKLIREKNRQGLSYAKMAELAVDPASDTKLSKPYLQRLVGNPPDKPPNREQRIALSNALGVSLRRVKAAIAEQWVEFEATELAGYNDEVRIIVGHLAGMPESELRRWRAMIEADERSRRDSE